jgi:hypothetical protein
MKNLLSLLTLVQMSLRKILNSLRNVSSLFLNLFSSLAVRFLLSGAGRTGKDSIGGGGRKNLGWRRCHKWSEVLPPLILPGVLHPVGLPVVLAEQVLQLRGQVHVGGISHSQHEEGGSGLEVGSRVDRVARTISAQQFQSVVRWGM